MDDLLSILPSFLPLPVVVLDDIKVPTNGVFVQCPTYCRKAFSKGKCAAHYQRLAKQGRLGHFYPCPQGFTSIPFSIGTVRLCFTCLVPTPRTGGKREAERAKVLPNQKVNRVALAEMLRSVKGAEAGVLEAFRREMNARLHALHEVRRLNATVRVITERLSRREADDESSVDPDVVRAMKASELMSYQLDALDLQSNPEIINGIPNTECKFYRLVDKIVRIYRGAAQDKEKQLKLTGGSSAITWVDSRSIHIVPSAFIDNAIKYSAPKSTITVSVTDCEYEGREHVELRVRSEGPFASASEEKQLFMRRFRSAKAKEAADGTGMGLVLASRVSTQHHGQVWATQERISDSTSRWEFGFRLLAKRNTTTSVRLRPV